MADDAAGAVRRTPRPEDSCRAYEVDGETVRVSGGEPLDEAGQAALGEIVRAATAKVAAEHPNLGVIQELIMAGLAANRAIHDGEVRGGCTIQDGAKVKARLKAAIGAARDALSAGTVLPPEVSHTVLQLGRDLHAARAEQDALLARIDAALRWLDEPQDLTPAGQLYQVRAALQGDQPTEPETRCMNGPAKQHTLRMVEIIKALRAASADGALPGELDDRASFAQLARAIVDHWPTGEADRG